jgi:hypothetical protein
LESYLRRRNGKAQEWKLWKEKGFRKLRKEERGPREKAMNIKVLEERWVLEEVGGCQKGK